MDVILSIDTYIVHLAGAMNIPAWIMLAYTPDWRWFLDRNDAPSVLVLVSSQQAPGTGPPLLTPSVLNLRF